MQKNFILHNKSTVKSCNSKSRYNNKSRYYNRLCDYAVMEASIEKSRYYDKSRYNDGFSADWALS